MRLHAWMLVLITAVGAIAAMRTHAEEPTAATRSDVVIERFAIPKGGDAILVPVTVGGKNHQFLLDTGCTKTILDEKLSKGRASGVETSWTPGRDVEVRLHSPPDAKVGKIALAGPTEVAVVDLMGLQEVMGYRFEGVLGFDFLRRHIIQINCDKGELLFLKSVPMDAGRALYVSYVPLDLPQVQAEIEGAGKIQFVIDTGFIGSPSASIAGDVLWRRVDPAYFSRIGRSLGQTLSGTVETRIYRGSRLRLDDFSVPNPIFDDSKVSMLGLGFLSRFKVTFDFPNHKMYLTPGQRYKHTDRWNASGLHVLRKSDAFVVHSVEEGSPSATVGLKSEDVVLEAGQKKASQMSLFELHQKLCEPGKLPLTVRRGDKEFRVTLTLP